MSKIIVNRHDSVSQPYAWYYNSPGCYNASGSGTVSVGAVRELVVGANTPNFHARQKAGELVESTPWLKYYGQWERIPGNFTASLRTGSYYSWTGWQAEAPAYVVDDPRAFEVSALENVDIPWADLANEAIAGLSPTFDLGTFIAELRETVQMIVGFAFRLKELKERYDWLRKRIDRFRRVRDPTDAAKVIDKLDGLYLEWQYGWRVLIQDLKNFTEAISEKSSVWQSGRGRYVVDVADYTDSALTQPYPNQYKKVERSEQLTVDASVNVRAKFTASPPRFEVDGLKTAYEVVPFSFVLDWFWNLGGYLSALILLGKVDVETELCYSRSLKITYRGQTVERVYSTDYKGSGSCDFRWDDCSCQSTAWAVLTRRWPTDETAKLPSFTLDLDVGQVVDLVALLWQVLRGLAKPPRA
jgi:hypothetical protein